MLNGLPKPLAALAEFSQFILWTTAERSGRLVKLPVDHRSAKVCDAHDSTVWTDYETASTAARLYGQGYGVGYVFTEADPFYFLDIDKCLENGAWSPLALSLCERLAGAAVEVSQSGRGLHIFGRSSPIEHRSKNIQEGLELYTSARFVALTGSNVVGDAATDSSEALAAIVADYFAPAETVRGAEWTEEPVEGYTSKETDDELIERALATQSTAAAFGGGATFADLWTAREDVLATAYPVQGEHGTYDASSADAALAQHLAWWTGGDCERIRNIMQRSALRREKYDREDYLYRTILRAHTLQADYYSVKAPTPYSDNYNAPRLQATSAKQRDYAHGLRETRLAQATPEQAAALCSLTGPGVAAKFWLDNQTETIETLVTKVTPVVIEEAPAETSGTVAAELRTGYQYLDAAAQLRYFAGCTYVQDVHRIATASGDLLKPDQFNAWYGGYEFQLDEEGKTTRKAWEAYTESRVAKFPRVSGTCFKPDLSTGVTIEQDGRSLVNVYAPVPVPMEHGDVAPFLEHLARVLPDAGDRAILLAYMAACVQHKGVKFQWTPLIQGTEGNGKTLFTRCVAAAIGRRYTHYPKAMDIDNKFNGWLLNKLFIGVEDIYVPDHRREVIETLKPMITGGDGLEIQLKGVDQITADVCANFMLNSNHKDAIRKTSNDRRFAVFYTAQQSAEDLERDGMTGDYFPNLYAWLKDGGYARVAYYLNTYLIPDALNPATLCHRAPVTTSTEEAIATGLGSIEQEVLEAIDEGLMGFAGGWVSSIALDNLLRDKGMARRLPQNKRRELMQGIGYEWHSALKNGRVNNPIAIDGNKKPKLFIKSGHLSAQLSTGSAVVAAYEKAQREVNEAGAASAFIGAST